MTKINTHTEDISEIRGWASIARFLGQPMTVAQKWSKTEGLPVVRKGRSVTATKDALNGWWLLKIYEGTPHEIAQA